MPAIAEHSAFVASEYLTIIRDFALRNAVSAKALLADTGQRLEFLLNPPPQVDESIMTQVSRNFLAAMDDPFLAAIQLGQSMPLSAHGTLGVALLGATNLQEAAHLASCYYSTRANSPQRAVEVVDSEQGLAFRFLHGQMEYSPRMYMNLSTLINFEFIARELLAASLPEQPCILSLNVSAPKHLNPQDLAENLPTSITLKFDQAFTQLFFPNSWLTLPLSLGDQELAQIARHQCDEDLKQLSPQDLIDQIRQRLALPELEHAGLQVMAQELCMSASTLQRRLRELNTTYQAIKSETRLQQAKGLLLEGQQGLEGIALQLGFSDGSNFSKFFKQQTGLTPKAYRQLHAQVG